MFMGTYDTNGKEITVELAIMYLLRADTGSQALHFLWPEGRETGSHWVLVTLNHSAYTSLSPKLGIFVVAGFS